LSTASFRIDISLFHFFIFIFSKLAEVSGNVPKYNELAENNYQNIKKIVIQRKNEQKILSDFCERGNRASRVFVCAQFGISNHFVDNQRILKMKICRTLPKEAGLHTHREAAERHEGDHQKQGAGTKF